MSRTSRIAVLAMSAALCLATPNRALAQSDIEINAALQFNFSNPGAKSLAMAGALTGLGDDATGAWTNPGGLTNLRRPEFAFEFRGYDYTNVFTTRGHAFGSPSNIGVDTVAGLQEGELSDRVNGWSFGSFVYPGNKWALAFYRTETANYRGRIETEGAFRGTYPTSIRRLRPAEGEVDLDVVSYGISAAVKLGELFSFGVGVNIYDLSMDAAVSRYSVLGGPSTGGGQFFGPPLYSSNNVANIDTQAGSGTKAGVNLGASATSRDGRFRFGAAFRQGAKFDLDLETSDGPAGPQPGFTIQKEGTFRVPDVYSVGVMFKPAQPLSVTVDYRRIQYSQLVKDFTIIVGDPNFDSPEEYVVDDGNEFRVGAEYFFANLKTPLAIRGGTWFDPDHRIRFEARDGRESANAMVFRAGEDYWHATGGFGLTIQKLVVDFGYDYSERFSTLSVSATVQF